MPQIEGAGLSAVEYSIDLVDVGEGHALPHLPFTDGHQFDGFKKIVAEIMVEVVFNATDFLVGFLWERGLQVVPDDAVAISDDAAH
jgi:hypothetical protein